MHHFRAWQGAAFLFALIPLFACASSENDGGSFPGTAGTAGNSGSAGTPGGGGSAGVPGGAGGESGGAGNDGGPSGSAGSAGSAIGGMGGLIDAGPPVNVSGYVVELGSTTTAPKPVSNMKVCAYGIPSVPCTISNGYGYYQVVGVPGGNEILLEFTKDGFFPVLRTITTGSTDMDIGSIPYPTVAQANLFATMAGTTLDSSKGQVLAMALKTVITADGGTVFDGQDGVSSTITPKSGTGPYYTSDGALPYPDPNLKATSTTGIGLFANVNPGEVEIEMTHPTKTCTRYVEGAWAGSTSTASRVPVIAGYLIGGAVLECPP